MLSEDPPAWVDSVLGSRPPADASWLAIRGVGRYVGWILSRYWLVAPAMAAMGLGLSGDEVLEGLSADGAITWTSLAASRQPSLVSEELVIVGTLLGPARLVAEDVELTALGIGGSSPDGATLLHQLSTAQLKPIAKSAGVGVGGRKADLCDRLGAVLSASEVDAVLQRYGVGHQKWWFMSRADSALGDLDLPS